MASWTSDDVPSILTNTTINTIKEVRDSTIQVFAEVAAALD